MYPPSDRHVRCLLRPFSPCETPSPRGPEAWNLLRAALRGTVVPVSRRVIVRLVGCWEGRLLGGVRTL